MFSYLAALLFYEYFGLAFVPKSILKRCTFREKSLLLKWEILFILYVQKIGVNFLEFLTILY